MSAHDEQHSGVDGFRQKVASIRELLHEIGEGSAAETAEGGLQALLRSAKDIVARLHASLPDPAGAAADAGPMLMLDVSDLLGYFQHNRLPTGIQRVQAELVANLVLLDAARTRLCCFDETNSQWTLVPSERFIELCAMSRAGGTPTEPDWVAAVRALKGSITSSPKAEMPRGSMLINVGASWWLPNYFLYVRQAKADFGVRYVPLIYDLIPALTPKFCDPELVREFIGWIINVLDHADFFVAISEATRRDLVQFAEKLGRPIAPERTAVMPLDADFRPAAAAGQSRAGGMTEPFVLFVSTLEARKNQLGAVEAWATLLARHGASKTPRLVLVGKRGFKSNAILERLRTDSDLAQRVTVLTSVGDAELRDLYRDCLFTIYPSYYEGWGLPVTESLCYGKVPVVADNSSLPEAGGPFASYITTGSSGALLAAVETLIFDPAKRQALEDRIKAEFAPRSWNAVAAGALQAISGWIGQPVAPIEPQSAPSGRYYPLERSHSSRVWPGMGTAEMFRVGLGWFGQEDFGSWTRRTGADIELRLADDATRQIAIRLACPPHLTARFRIELLDHDDVFVSGIIAETMSRWAILDLPALPAGTMIRVRLSTTAIEEPPADKADHRALGVGMRGFFLLDGAPASRLEFVEAAALGSLSDLSFYAPADRN